MISDPKRLEATFTAFDAANAEDPNLDEGQPKELLYAERMSAMLERYAPDASEALRLMMDVSKLRMFFDV